MEELKEGRKERGKEGSKEGREKTTHPWGKKENLSLVP